MALKLIQGKQINVNLTGSFTGSFTGDGSGLYNIPASGITGLNLSQISSGSVSASISPDSGLQINTNVSATSFTGSLFGTSSWAISASHAVDSLSSSFAATASYAPSYLPLTGGTIVGDLSVIGTASFVYTTASIVQVGSNTITLNTDYPATRFGGISVIDSGSFGNSSTGSLYWDSLMNRWVYSNPSGSTYDGGLVISGPRNTSGLGNEEGTTLNALMKGQGGDHITSSAVFEVSGSVGIGTSTPSASLHIAAPGTGSTDIALRVRNNANTADLMSVNGIGTVNISDNLFLQNTKGLYFLTTSLGITGNTGIGSINLVTNSTNRLTIDNSGNISAVAAPSAAFSNIYMAGSNIEFRNGIHNFSWENTGNVFQIKNITNANTIPFIIFKTTNNIGIGTTTDNGGKLQIVAPGTGSTDIALRVRNNANTADLFIVNGVGNVGIQAASSFSLNGVGGGNGLISGGNSFLQITNRGGQTITLFNGGNEAQQGIQIGYNLNYNGTPPNLASSILELTSTTKGFLPPRTNLTSNITSPAQGLILYATGSTNEGLYYFNSGSTPGWRQVADTTNAFIQGGNSFGTTALLGTNDEQSLALETSGSTRMFISSSGNVGIGTAAPTAPLDVRGNLSIAGPGLDGDGSDRLIIGGRSAQLASIQLLNSSTGKIHLNPWNNTGVVITGSLTISGNISSNGSVTLASDQGIFGNGSSFFKPYEGATGNLLLRAAVADSNLSVIRLQTGASSTDRFVVRQNGNILINTTTDNGGKLQIVAPGTGSTDIAFRVRNSADTADLLSVNGLGGITNTGVTTFDISTATQVNSRVVVFNTNGSLGGYNSGYDFKTGYNGSNGSTAFRIWSTNTRSSIGIGDLTEANIGSNTAQLYINSQVTGGRNAGIRISPSASSTTQYNGIQFDFNNKDNNGGAFIGSQYNPLGTGYGTDLVVLTTNDTINTYSETARFIGKFNSFLVGSNKTLAAASAKLQVESTTQGFLPPRTNLTSNITSPAQGLITYLTGSTNEGLYYYNSGSTPGWRQVADTTFVSSSVSGSTNYLPKFTGANSLGNSLVYDDGTNVGIGTTAPTAKLDINGLTTATSAIAKGINFSNTLVASANNDILVGLDIQPTFTNGAFTGVNNYNIRTGGLITKQYFQSPTTNQGNHSISFGFGGTGEQVKLIASAAGSSGRGNLYIASTTGDSAVATTANANALFTDTANILYKSFTLDQSTLTTGNGLYVYGNQPNGITNGIYFKYSESRVAILSKPHGGNGYADFRIAIVPVGGANNPPLEADTKFMITKDTTNVLINTTTDTGYKLDVSGSGRFTNGLTNTGSLSQSGSSTFNGGNYLFKASTTGDAGIQIDNSINGYSSLNWTSNAVGFGLMAGGGLFAKVANNAGLHIGTLPTSTSLGATLGVIGSAIITSGLTVTGSVQISSSIFQYSNNAAILSGSTANVASFPTSSYMAGFFDFVASSGTNARAGTIFTVWNGTSLEYVETSTNDIGSTTNLILSASLSGSNVLLQGTSLSGSWNVKTLTRMI